MPSFKKSLIVEQFQGNYLKIVQILYILLPLHIVTIVSKFIVLLLVRKKWTIKIFNSLSKVHTFLILYDEATISGRGSFAVQSGQWGIISGPGTICGIISGLPRFSPHALLKFSSNMAGKRSNYRQENWNVGTL